MTREEAARVLQAQINYIKANHKLGQLTKERIQDDYKLIVALRTAIADMREIDAMYATDTIGESMVETLKKAQLADNGLVPCGCGERAMILGLQGFCYKCIACGTTTRNFETEAQAKAAWNTALRDALKRQPDPITGLMPCGCGGVTEQTDFHDGFFPYSKVECLECGIQMMRAGDTFLEAHAEVKRDWNTAMGWKGGAE